MFSFFSNLPNELQNQIIQQSLYEELLAITESSTLIWYERLDHLQEKASENPEAGYLILFYPKIWQWIVSIKNPYGPECIKAIAQTSYKTGCLLLRTKELVNYVLTHPYGREYIKDIAATFPETARYFFEQEHLVNLILEHLRGEELIVLIAEKAPNVFLTKQQLVDRVLTHRYGEAWIQKIQALAAQEIENAMSAIPQTTSNLHY